MDPYDKEKTRQIWKRVLGEEEPEDGCAMDSERLRAMIADEKTDACVYRVLARRAGSGGETLRRISREEQRHAKRLETVYFLWTGEKAQAVSNSLPKYGCMAEALRDRHQHEMAGAKRYCRTAEELPEFRSLFLELAADETCHGEHILRLLQDYV